MGVVTRLNPYYLPSDSIEKNSAGISPLKKFDVTSKSPATGIEINFE